MLPVLLVAFSTTRQLKTVNEMPANGSVRAFWNTADPRYAHISYSGYLRSEEALVAYWQNQWLNTFAPYLTSTSRVVEYGIGAGLLGKVLLRDYNVAHYVGLDISDRQIAAASAALSTISSSRYTLRRVDAIPSLEQYAPTVFISQAVIQQCVGARCPPPPPLSRFR